ncbi:MULTISPECIES: hypothetical protein [Phaeobacter]|uniref:hypothetical protein n=1 Tax=Phaeobacter TaxID=302485 RepID=UPI00237FA3C8|nr:hypothetical protein [Phaeobacter gallaeciensis]MDE4098303.1 hypothetical protein [Phaeobacter gallaeciensis]MDE4107113.1 hypothetical protein [Phaeobacter gallaeciensis]MDE4111428.1 hypothetical protein [Phaeobacter gallaeciensis]MDE4116038.1 hypothetical protein [Phaeobacter gallaeciensis]MDE4120369.1 hypothetical protein [Phaeobacter gallaeciensis]
MNKLFDDILTLEELAAIDAVHSSNSTRFDVLVRLAGLDPSKDFRFSQLLRLDLRSADLRDFDFTGSDLRQSVVDAQTIIDKSTILDGAQIDWISAETLPIVQQMQEIEAALSSDKRLALIQEMIKKHGRTNHVVTYLVRAAIAAKEIETFLDFVTNLPAELDPEQVRQLSAHGTNLLEKKFKKNQSRTRRSATAKFAIEPIVKRLQESPGGFGAQLFGKLAEVMNDKAETIQLKGVATTEPQDLRKAFALLRRN